MSEIEQYSNIGCVVKKGNEMNKRLLMEERRYVPRGISQGVVYAGYSTHNA